MRKKDITIDSDKEFNTTDIDPFSIVSRGVVHPDGLAHIFRWWYILEHLKPTDSVLDVACGKGYQGEVFYRNRTYPERYLGIDIRKTTIKNNQEKFKNVPWMEFKELNLADKSFTYDGTLFNKVVSFETIEHVNKKNGETFLQNIKKMTSDDATFYLSTPNRSDKWGVAQNHIYDGEVQEYYHDELQALLEKHFTIEAKYGTFIAITDFKKVATPQDLQFFEKMNEYYHQTFLRTILAKNYPEESRNCLWVLKAK